LIEYAVIRELPADARELFSANADALKDVLITDIEISPRERLAHRDNVQGLLAGHATATDGEAAHIRWPRVIEFELLKPLVDAGLSVVERLESADAALHVRMVPLKTSIPRLKCIAQPVPWQKAA